MWVLDDDHTHMIQRDITYVPGLYKIFDEILGRQLYKNYVTGRKKLTLHVAHYQHLILDCLVIMIFV